ncbi:MAG: NUDIX hydrolase [Asgard group archaeon]|nr:NUDIX hydrolase [Asgard group archaeon]
MVQSYFKPAFNFLSPLKYILLTRNHLLISPLKEKCHHIQRGNWILKKWKTIGTKLRYNSEFVSVFDDKVILPSGQQIEYTKIELRDFVSVISLIDNRVVMIEILRYPRNCISLEIPSGHIEDYESAEEAAVRELEEETGYKPEKITKIACFHPLSRSTQSAHIFFANALKKGMQRLETTEQINLKLVPVEKIKEILFAGEITHPPTIIALQRFLLTRQEELI